MKPLSNKLIAAAAIAALFTVACAVPVRANDTGKDPIPVELKLMGTLNNCPAFQLVFSNPENSFYTVTIRDENDVIWYKDKVKGGSFSKIYLVKTDELGNVPFAIEVSGRSTDKTVVYQVNRKLRLVEDLVVKKQ
jgi:hypothetical protein